MYGNGVALRRGERDSGFTLVELVVAMFVIAVVLMLLAGVQISAMQSIVNATKREQATAFANQAMETMRALPWDTLSKGNVPGFHTAGGNTDPYYTGNNSSGSVTIDGATYPVRLAITNPQDTSNPRPPLFDASGSNHSVQHDPAKPDVAFDVRSYIVDSLSGSAASVGLLVIVSWTNAKTGATDDLALRSSAYPGSAGCGDKSELPYLVACQDRLSFSATSGYVSTSLTGTVSGDTSVAPLIASTDVQEASLRSALVTAAGDSVQVTSTSGEARRGGTTVKRIPSLPGGTSPVDESGYGSVTSGATNNYAVPTGTPADDTVPVGVTTSSAQSKSNGSMSIAVRSDDTRTGTSRSNMTQACLGVQLLAGEPCTYTDLSGTGGLYASMTFNSATMYPVWRSSSALSTAGGGRFSTNPPGVQFGCQTLATSGCASGKATYSEPSLRLGYLASGSWDQGINTLIEIANYTDSALAQRGSVQTSTAPTIERAATIRYWNGSAMATTSVNANSNGLVATAAPVTWSPAASVTVEASGAVSATRAGSQLLGQDPVVDCRDDTCAVSANAGSLTVSIRYVITSPFGNWDIVQQTVLAGSAASASFDRRT